MDTKTANPCPGGSKNVARTRKALIPCRGGVKDAGHDVTRWHNEAPGRRIA